MLKRIVFCGLPRLLRDILQTSFAIEPSIAVLGEAHSLEELLLHVQQGVDVVILGLREVDLPESHYQLFDADPRVRILAIADHGRDALLYELRPHRIVLGEGSPQELMELVRQQVRDEGAIARTTGVAL
jgi:DNA-binding NarL/FixJ family response regulator